MRRALATTFLFFLIPLYTQAASGNEYWVLGSFADENNARSERQRLETELAVEVLILYSELRDSYRVAVATIDLAESAARAIDTNAWSMSLSGPPELPTEVAIPEAEWQPLYPAFKNGETVIDYCKRLPDSPLCTDPRSTRLLENAGRVSGEKAADADVCKEISNPEYRATCLRIHGTE